jgi:hypothetical protein
MPAYGETARSIYNKINNNSLFEDYDIKLRLTKMAKDSTDTFPEYSLETNQDIFNYINEIKQDLNTKIIFFNCALNDWVPAQLSYYDRSINRYVVFRNIFGKYENRLSTANHSNVTVELVPSEKVISNIRKGRKDIFLVGFKTTCGASKHEMYLKGLNLCKKGSVNLVLVNDVKTRWNMIVVPEEAAYHETNNRDEILNHLVDMTYHRSRLSFTNSKVVDGNIIKWDDPQIPTSLKTVIEHCIRNNAYKKFNGSTVGHFAVKVNNNEFITSIRKSDFNSIDKTGMVRVVSTDKDSVVAYGAKPSVGGQSQRIVFSEHDGMDCIVHFHSPLKPNHRDNIPIVSQREVECGSHECGQNTSRNLKSFGDIKAVMLDNHGPNIVFNRNISPEKIIEFINENFDLSQKTGGYNL